MAPNRPTALTISSVAAAYRDITTSTPIAAVTPSVISSLIKIFFAMLSTCIITISIPTTATIFTTPFFKTILAAILTAPICSSFPTPFVYILLFSPFLLATFIAIFFFTTIFFTTHHYHHP